MQASSHTWIERITLVLTGMFGTGGILAFLKVFLDWRRPKKEAEQIGANTGRIQAETEGIQIGNALNFTRQLFELQLQMNRIEAEFDEKVRAKDKEAEFLRSQVRYLEEMDVIQRNRLHAMAGELGNLVIHLSNIERTFSEQQLPLVQYRVRTYDEIIKDFPLPERPKE